MACGVCAGTQCGDCPQSFWQSCTRLPVQRTHARTIHQLPRCPDRLGPIPFDLPSESCRISSDFCAFTHSCGFVIAQFMPCRTLSYRMRNPFLSGSECNVVRRLRLASIGNQCVVVNAVVAKWYWELLLTSNFRHSSEGWNPAPRKIKYLYGLGPSLRWDDGVNRNSLLCKHKNWWGVSGINGWEGALNGVPRCGNFSRYLSYQQGRYSSFGNVLM